MVVGLQLALVAALLAFLGYVLKDVWAAAVPRLADTDPVFLVAALAVLAAYYLLFAVGWWWPWPRSGFRVSYGDCAPGRDGVDAGQVHPGRNLDAARQDRLAPPRRRKSPTPRS